MTDALDRLIEASDLDGLVKFVDSLSGAADWDGLVSLPARCREAVQRGKQVWAAAEFAEYRIALEAPAPLAAGVVAEGAGRYALGPLWEVAASTHTWADLEPHLGPGPARAMVAHERAVRGEDLRGVEVEEVLEIPLRLEPWEPPYPVAEYHADKAEFPAPGLPKPAERRLPPGAEPVAGDPGAEALDALVRPWAETSNGRVESVAVWGDHSIALASLGLHRCGVAGLSSRQALALMAWAGASGGAHGRRRGTPVGRYGAWWAVSVLGGLEWPPMPADVGAAAARLRWFLWDPGDQIGGWSCRLAVEDGDRGVSWALGALDST